jgi:putative chitinase
MPIMNTRITLSTAPNGDDQDVIVKRSAPVKVLETKEVDGETWAKIQLLQGDATGWVPNSAIGPDAAAPDRSINASDFARQCWWVCMQYGSDPYYMVAVAQLQSNLANDQDAGGIGPFRFAQAEWDAGRTNPQVGLTAYSADDISDWGKQCIMYGILAQNAADTLASLLGRQPTWIELYLSQMIGARPTSAAIANPGATIDKAFAGLKPADFSTAGLTADQTLDRYSAYLRDPGPPPRVLKGSDALDQILKNLKDSLDLAQKTVDDVSAEFVDATDDAPTSPPVPTSPVPGQPQVPVVAPQSPQAKPPQAPQSPPAKPSPAPQPPGPKQPPAPQSSQPKQPPQSPQPGPQPTPPQSGGIHREFFFKQLRRTLFPNGLNQDQVNGLSALLDEWEAEYAHQDDRWLAYALGTTHHENDKQFRPIPEIGRGRGHQYGIPDPVTGKIYYGRGFVQLTWKKNYKAMGTALGVDLVNDPDRALDFGVATKILFLGMTRGMFTGKKLGDYFNSKANDWINARRIINGTDRASLVADYGEQYYAAISYTK